MRMLSLVGVLVALVIVGLLVRKSLGTVVVPTLAPVAQPSGGAPAPAATPQQQLQQLKQSLDAAASQPRVLPDEAR